MEIAGRRPEDRAAIRQGDIAVNLVIADTNSMTYSFAVEFEVPRADPRRRATPIRQMGTRRPVRRGTRCALLPAKGRATVLWWPTRSKAARFSTRRQASEGRSGGPAIRHRICGQQHLDRKESGLCCDICCGRKENPYMRGKLEVSA